MVLPETTAVAPEQNLKNHPIPGRYRSKFNNRTRQLTFTKKQLQTSNVGVGPNGFVSQSSFSNYR